MTTNIGADGALYNTKIPRLDENADIQAALRIYHYGDNINDPGDSPDANSVAGFLYGLEESKLTKSPQSLPVEAHDLDEYVEIGLYAQSEEDLLDVWSNYPSAPGKPGLLRVDVDGPIVYQTFHLATSNDIYWRALVGTWSTWKQAQKLITGAATSILYVPLTSSRAVISDNNGKVAASTVTATELENLSGTSGTVPSLAGTVGGDGESKKMFIQELEPNEINNPGYVPQNGDLWFW